jgi:hypothetical protein
MRRIYNVKGEAKSSREEFVRYLGKKLTGDGRAVDAKFYLGINEGEATMNRLRLEKLWARIVEGTPPSGQPAWDAIAFEVGKAVAKGAVVYRLPRTLVPVPDEEGYVHFVARYAKMCESVVQVVPEDDAAYSAGLGVIERERVDAIRQRIDPGWPSASEFPPPVIPVGRPDETLHKALDAYIAELEKEAGGDYSGWLGTQIRQAKTLKEHNEDRPLGLVDEGAIRAMAKYWEGRPKVKGREKAMAVVSVKKQWESLVRFLRWVHRSKEYAWRLPEGGLDDIKFKPRSTDEEDAMIASTLQVEVWTPAQLALLYKHATPLVRCMMLLGLNCGFKPIDVGTSQSATFRLGESHPHADYLLNGEPQEAEHWRTPADWLMTLRKKTKVYGEFFLWRYTAAAIRWAKARKLALGLGANPLLLPTDRGTSYTKPTSSGKKPARIANLWSRTVQQAQQEEGSLPNYPFSSLRDTGADLIRRRDDTAANLYLRHGKPYKNDSLLELYSNRPFLRLHQELKRVEGVLAPLWQAVPAPFPVEEGCG